MGDLKGFLKVKRRKSAYRPVCERVGDFREVTQLRQDQQAQEQAGRCMDCGTPFCHWACPVGNYIPEWNDLVFSGNRQKAFELLQAVNNLPEITGRLCPALCEYACVLGINDDPVTVRENELDIVEYAFKNGLIEPRPPKKRTGKKIAVVGSGPAGLSCADQLNKAGHHVTVFEKDDLPGGILRYGIPDFKLEKKIIDRRLELFRKEGIEFSTGKNVGVDISVRKLIRDFDAVVLAGGARAPRDLPIEGRQLKGVYFAMDYLIQSNKRVAGIPGTHYLIPGRTDRELSNVSPELIIDAKGKKVVVIGGGDTGADCVGTAHRQGASCVVQIELLPKPPECRSCEQPWPEYPSILKTSTSHEEGGMREWSVLTKKFAGEGGAVKRLECARVDFSGRDKNNCPVMKEVPGSAFSIDADMVVLALGFVHPEHGGLLEELGVEQDARGNVKTGADYKTSVKGVFAAGDMHRGQSLIVWAISEGRTCAHHVDKFLMGESRLPVM